MATITGTKYNSKEELLAAITGSISLNEKVHVETHLQQTLKDMVVTLEDHVTIVEYDHCTVTRTLVGNIISILVKVNAVTSAQSEAVELIPAGLFKFFEFDKYVQSVDAVTGIVQGVVTVDFDKLAHDSDSESFSMVGSMGAIGEHSILIRAAEGSSTIGSLLPAYHGGSILPIIDSTGLQCTINWSGETSTEYSFLITGSVWSI